MGRLNFYVQHRFSCQTTGIELNETYYEIALKNLNSYKGIHHEQIHFHLVSAIEYTIEVSQNIFYFFNPFSIEIFMHVVGNILDSFYEHPRKITIMLNYPDSEYIYYLNEYTPFSLIQEIKVPDKYEKDSRECVLIYEMNFSI